MLSDAVRCGRASVRTRRLAWKHVALVVWGDKLLLSGKDTPKSCALRDLYRAWARQRLSDVNMSALQLNALMEGRI